MQFQAYTVQRDSSWAAIYITPPSPQERTPIHICILLDVSWSMGDDNKLETFVLSIQALIDNLGPLDHISLITFSNNATIILNYINTLPTNKEKLYSHLSVIKAYDKINMGAALIKAQEVLQKNISNIKQGVILITNGHVDMGVSDTTTLLSMANQLLTNFPETSLFTVAYGLDHDKELLQKMAIQGGGTYTTVSNIEDVATVFGDIIGGLLSAIVQQIRVIVPKGTAIQSCYSMIETVTEMEIIVGDLSVDMEAIFLVQLPKDTSLQLKGNIISTNESIEMTTTIIDTDNEKINDKNNLHYIRFKVVLMIEKITNSTYWNDILRDKYKIEINELTMSIYRYYAINQHYLLEHMLNELNVCVYIINLPYLHLDIHHLYRNSKVLGQHRGIYSIYEHKRQSSSTVKSIYSNSIQLYFSQKFRKMIDEIKCTRHTKKDVYDTCFSPPLILHHYYVKYENSTIIEYINMKYANKETVEYTNMTIAEVVNASR
jgi:hypothetical protein